MISPAVTHRNRLLVAGTLGALVLAFAAAPAAVRADEGECRAAAAPNGKVFGKRFGKLLGSAGIAALTGRKAAARAAADAAGRDVVDSARENAIASAAATSCDPSAESSGQAPPAAKAQAGQTYRRPGLIPVSAEIKARKQAFDEFGKVACDSCEGGFAFDSWANQFFYSELRDQKNGWESKLAALQPGETINWQGSESYGTIALRGNERIAGFDCKTFDWTLEKGAAGAQRDGLVCWGKASDYSANDSWVEVY